MKIGQPVEALTDTPTDALRKVAMAKPPNVADDFVDAEFGNKSITLFLSWHNPLYCSSA